MALAQGEHILWMVLLSRHIFKSFATMAVDKPVAKALEVVTSRVRAASAKVNRAPVST
jgi:hypothetical protein